MDTPTSKELKKVKNKRQLEIRDAFVTFEHEESRERCVEDYRAYLESDRRFSRIFCCLRWRPSHTAMPDKLKVKCGSGGGREAVAVEEVDEEEFQQYHHDDSTYYQQQQGYDHQQQGSYYHQQQGGYYHHQQQQQQQLQEGGNGHYYEDEAYENDGGEYWV